MGGGIGFSRSEAEEAERSEGPEESRIAAFAIAKWRLAPSSHRSQAQRAVGRRLSSLAYLYGIRRIRNTSALLSLMSPAANAQA